MKLLRGLIAALAIYSRIPMPRIELNKDDMKHCLLFLSLVGVIIGGGEVFVFELCKLINLPELVLAILLTLVPIVITGGFHIDGLMDVMDAKGSYGSIEEKQRILSDPHIGAFSVIGLVKYGLLYIAAMIVIGSYANKEAIYCLGLSFVLSRSLCGISAMALKAAKDKGMLKAEREGALSVDCILMAIISVAVGGLWIYVNLPSGLLAILFQLALFIYYKSMCYKEFGGVSGDTCGYYICMSELISALAIAVALIIR